MMDGALTHHAGCRTCRRWSIAAMEDRGSGYVIGVDSDWYYAYPENRHDFDIRCEKMDSTRWK